MINISSKIKIREKREKNAQIFNLFCKLKFYKLYFKKMKTFCLQKTVKMCNF